MSAQPKRALNEDGYLALERAADSKSEFFDGEMVAMTGARARHNEIAFNISVALGSRLPGSCRGYTSDMKVRVPAGANFYPDITVTCGEALYLDDGQDVLLNPMFIVEVLSPSTEALDRGRKFAFYRTIASLKAYLLVAADRIQVDLYLRQGDTDRWTLVSAESVTATIDLESLGCSIPVAELYRGRPT